MNLNNIDAFFFLIFALNLYANTVRRAKAYWIYRPHELFISPYRQNKLYYPFVHSEKD